MLHPIASMRMGTMSPQLQTEPYEKHQEGLDTVL